ncbi:MAG TPA: tetratricopeptide repeat protein [Candidatus Dormibacteraeota bacterium]|jgi:Flp pilus assembly protein TadD|nr:tetratricopeptide repeat protein [Candidatus Dormibacteraeota bacterium]
MPATGASQVSERATATGTTHAKLPGAAQRLRLPLHARSQARMATRWGFDLNTPDASERAEALLADSPDDVDRLLLVASVRSSRGDDSAALAAARAAAEKDEGSASAQSTVAALLARSGDLATAQRHAQAAVDIDPQDPSALYNLGLVRWTLGDRRAARGDFDRAADILGIARASWWRRRTR